MVMPKVSIFIPVSRHAHLDALFARLELMDCDAKDTNIFCLVDGDAELYVKTRNLVQQSKFNERLCVQRQDRTPVPMFDRIARRKRIASVHQEAKQHLPPADLVFGLEDDTIPPLNALERLLDAYAMKPHAGFISGIQLGRWGLTYIGAWRADDVYDSKRLETILRRADEHVMEPVDAAGFFCYLTPYKLFMEHKHAPFESNAFGPDVNYGIWLRQQGYQNYVLWNVNCDHKTNHGKSVKLGRDEPMQVMFTKNNGRWLQRK